MLSPPFAYERFWRDVIKTVRSFAWYDLITFYRFRRNVVCTHNAHALTFGNPTGPVGFISRINPAVGLHTCVLPSQEGNAALIGQIQYVAGERSARIVYLMPDQALCQPAVVELIEGLLVKAGTWGAFHLLAEADESSCAMEGLRRAGFSVYARQRIWQFTPAEARQWFGSSDLPGMWQPAVSSDEISIRMLYQSLAPPLVQSAEPLSTNRPLGWVFRQDGEILAYVEGLSGPLGIYLQPLIHPEVEHVGNLLRALIALQRNPLGRPIYIAIRSYQAWLETALRDAECQVAPRQALLVKHLTVQQRAPAIAARHSVLEKYAVETTGQMVNNFTPVNKDPCG